MGEDPASFAPKPPPPRAVRPPSLRVAPKPSPPAAPMPSPAPLLVAPAPPPPRPLVEFIGDLAGGMRIAINTATGQMASSADVLAMLTPWAKDDE